jgi:predicted transposase YbfD/YdcC
MAQCGDYLIELKDNQGMPHKDVTAYFANKTTLQNSLISAADIAWRQQEYKWPGLNSIGMVATTVWKKDKMIAEQRCYISSLPANARQLNHAASAHWSIENQLHWRLAVVFHEDGAGVRYDNAAENRNIWRKWPLNALQQVARKPGQSTQSLMRKSAMSFKHPQGVYKTIFHA